MKPTNPEIALFNEMIKPLQKNDGLKISIHRYYTDVNGTIVDKSLVPASIQKSFPFWMFGQFDKNGGYRVGNTICPPDNNTPYLGTWVNGLDLPFLFATGLNTVQNFMNIGDLVHIFTDDLNAPTYYIWIVQSCSSASLASIYNNAIAPEKQKINIRGVNYFAYSSGNLVTQFTQVINMTRIDVIGAWNNKPETALAYYQTDDKQPNFITIPITFQVDQYNLISSYIDFEMDYLSFSFMLKKNTFKA